MITLLHARKAALAPFLTALFVSGLVGEPAGAAMAGADGSGMGTTVAESAEHAQGADGPGGAHGAHGAHGGHGASDASHRAPGHGSTDGVEGPGATHPHPDHPDHGCDGCSCVAAAGCGTPAIAARTATMALLADRQEALTLRRAEVSHPALHHEIFRPPRITRF